MKNHTDTDREAVEQAENELCEAFQALRSAHECKQFLWDLCTPAELEAMVDRWRVVSLLKQGCPYREINQITGVSVTTVGRVARFLEYGNGGYRTAWERLQDPG